MNQMLPRLPSSNAGGGGGAGAGCVDGETSSEPKSKMYRVSMVTIKSARMDRSSRGNVKVSRAYRHPGRGAVVQWAAEPYSLTEKPTCMGFARPRVWPGVHGKTLGRRFGTVALVDVPP